MLLRQYVTSWKGMYRFNYIEPVPSWSKIREKIIMKNRSKSEDMQKFESVKKCEHPCHSNTDESWVIEWDETWNVAKQKEWGGISQNDAVFLY